MDKTIDLEIRILGWSLIVVGMVLLFLMVIGLLHSPSIEFVSLLVTSGVFITVGYLSSKTSRVLYDVNELKEGFNGLDTKVNKLESRFDLVWSDFKKRKEI